MIFEEHKNYWTRNGGAVRIDKITETAMLGHPYRFQSIQLQWHLDGMRFPRGGEDPFDIIGVE